MADNERIFELIGDRCIKCNRGCVKEEGYSRWASQVFALRVEVNDGYGWDFRWPLTICMFGKSGERGSRSDTKRPDLKQPDGWTPRVCVNHERYFLRDSETRTVLFKGTGKTDSTS